MHKDQLTLYGNLYSKQDMVAAGLRFKVMANAWMANEGIDCMCGRCR